METKKKTVIIIAGPTAVGKSAVAIRLAQYLHTQIISADSRQCFNELNIGVAKPSAEELNAVHHYFINSHSIHQEVNAAIFEQYALDAANKIFEQHDVAVMVGGTGLYIKAFCEGLDAIPEVPAKVRQQVINIYHSKGLPALQEEVQQRDPAFWQTAEQQNPQRLMRALEILLTTHQPISASRKGEKKQREFNIIKIALELPRELLYQQVNTRVDQMMEAGLLEETRALLPFRHLNALQTVGYRELFPVFDGTETIEAAIEELKMNTRHYAKRQVTWFKKDPAFTWLHAHDPQLVSAISDKLMD